MSGVDPSVASAVIGAIGLVIGALFANLPRLVESSTAAGRARADARKAAAEADRIDAENDLERARRDRAEIVWLSNERKRLMEILQRHKIDPNESDPLDTQPIKQPISKKKP